MKSKSKKFGTKQSCGATLVEAVVALAILGSLLTALIVANRNFTKQKQAAENRMIGCKLLDDFLTRNWENREVLLIEKTGALPQKDWSWRLKELDSKVDSNLKSRKVKIEAIAPGASKNCASLEVLIPR